MKKTRIWSLMICVLLFFTTAVMPIYGASAIALSLDDQSLTSDAAPVIQDGRTLVPIRIITENLDCDVKWDQDTKTVTITEENGSILKLTIGSKEGTKIAADGTESTFQMEVPASIINGRTMIPIRAITENLSSAPQIGWSNAQRKVCIYTPDYLTEKGISDVNAYVAAFKSPPTEATGVKSLGTWNIAVDWYNQVPVTLIQVNGVKYIYAGDLVNKVINPQTSSYETTFNAAEGHFHAQFDSSNSGNEEKISYAETYSDMFDFYVGSNSAEQLSNTLSTYTITSEGGENTIEALKQVNNGAEGVKTEDAPDGLNVYRTSSIHYKLNNPAILYNGMLWVPFEGFFYSWNYDSVAHQKCTFAYKDNVAYAMSEYYMKETGKTKESIEGTKPATTTPTQPAQTINVNIGDTVYATTAFFKCWGTVQQISGSKAQVQWTQVTDMYGFMVKDYMDEMDIYSQLSMSKKGIMIGTSTWVDISILNKN